MSQQEAVKVTAKNPGENKENLEMGNETENQGSSSWMLQQRTTQRGWQETVQERKENTGTQPLKTMIHQTPVLFTKLLQDNPKYKT